MIERLRQVGWFEGVSLLVLVFVAMPLKYIWEMPTYVSVVGPIHGFFFTVYCVQLVVVWKKYSWSLDRMLTYWVGALIPFGVFVVEKRFRSQG